MIELKIEYAADQVQQVMDYGNFSEAWLNITDDLDTPDTLRLCTPCYEGLGRYRLGNKGDPWMGEDVLCMTHFRRRELGVSEVAFNAPIGVQGRPRTQGGPCSVGGCSQPSRAKGLCRNHYMADYRSGPQRVGRERLEDYIHDERVDDNIRKMDDYR